MQEKNWRQIQVLKAAMQCFLQHGIRGTSMELVAQEAGVAKATLYKYFADKHVLFEAVISHFLEKVRGNLEPLARADGPPADVITALLIAKYEAIDEQIAKSAHADEFFKAYNSGAFAAFSDMENWIILRVAEILENYAAKDSQFVAQIIVSGVSGLTSPSRNIGDWKVATQFMVERLIGEMPSPAR